MRVLILALAILLLPLRGWLGDAMAMDMAKQQVAAAAAPAAGHSAHAMHAMQAMNDADTAADAGAPSHEHGAQPDCTSTCTSCQLCHNIAMTVWPDMPTTGEAPRAAPSFEPVAFASAEPAPGFKPPIS